MEGSDGGECLFVVGKAGAVEGGVEGRVKRRGVGRYDIIIGWFALR